MIRLLIVFVLWPIVSYSQSFAPAPGEIGSTAIYKDSSVFVSWATGVSVTRGYLDIQNPNEGYTSFGVPEDAIGEPIGNFVVSLGDGGQAILTFNRPITNGIGPDFAIFENGFADHYIELAFVEVSSNGIDYVRFPAISEEQNDTQIDNFSFSNCAYFSNFAGKYRANYGTPFDLEELIDSNEVDVNAITHIKLIDVVGSIDPQFGTVDSQGNIINDTYPTAFPSGGFDLDGVGVINELPLDILENETIEFSINSNPTEGEFIINTSEIGAYVVFNNQGKKIEQGSFKESFKLNLTRESGGVYFLQIQSDNRLSHVRLIKL